MRRSVWPSLALGLVLAGGTTRADVWDVGTETDNDAGTDNELIHGTSQIHDLGALGGVLADRDWYSVGQNGRSSYEVVIDSTTGDIGPADLLQLVLSDGTLIQSAVPVAAGLGNSRSLRFLNTTAGTVTNEYVRVGPALCGAACTVDDQYHIRMMETTIEVARFNNAGSQVTVLLTQNASDVPINATFFYWNAAGTLLTTGNLIDFPAKQLNVFNTASFPALAGVSGHITIAHDAPYGTLNVKTVALEPSTGFSFDTPGVYRGF